MKCSMRRRTLREATYCLYVIINDRTVLMLNERKVSIQISYRSSWPFIASSHCWRDAIWPIKPVLMRRMVLYTLRLVRWDIMDPGSSRSSAAIAGSWRWISPSVAVLTGTERPLTPPTAREGGGMKYVSCCLDIRPAAGGWRDVSIVSSSPEGRTRSNSAWVFLGTSRMCNSLVSCWMSSEISGDGGQRAEAACACSSSRCFISARRVILRVPTHGAGACFCGARQVPRPLLLPCLATGDGVSGTTFISCSGVLSCARGGVIGGVTSSVTGRYCKATRLAWCDDGGAEEARGRGSSSAGLGRTLCDLGSARGVEICSGSSVKRFTGGGSSLTKSKSQRIVLGGARSGGGGGLFSSCFSISHISAYLGVSASGECLGGIHKVELPRHLTRAEADTLVTSCISEGVSASVSAEYNTPKFVDNPKYVLAPMTKSHNLAVLRNIFKISFVMLFQYVLAR